MTPAPGELMFCLKYTGLYETYNEDDDEIRELEAGDFVVFLGETGDFLASRTKRYKFIFVLSSAGVGWIPSDHVKSIEQWPDVE